jgi:hypothetical protein
MSHDGNNNAEYEIENGRLEPALRLLRGVKVPESPQGFFNPVNVRPNQGEKTPPSR